MIEIINAKQAQVLSYLETVVDAKHAEVMQNTGICKSQYQLLNADLRERELVYVTPMAGTTPVRISVTSKGIRALRHFCKKAQGHAMVHERINVMSPDYPTYRPTQWVCTRLAA